MNKKIEIIYDAPIIFTKDKNWLSLAKPRIKPGAIIALPDDAVLYIPRQQVGVNDMVKSGLTHGLSLANPPKDKET